MGAFRYLDTEIEDILFFSEHGDSVHKKAQQRLFFLRKLKSFNVRKDVLTAVDKSLIESVLAFTSWYNFLFVKKRSKLSYILIFLLHVCFYSKSTCVSHHLAKNKNVYLILILHSKASN